MLKMGRRFKIQSKKVLTLIVLVLLIGTVTGMFLFLHKLHKPAVVPSNSPPLTGVSLIFSPPLANTAKVEVDNSNDQVVKTVNLTRAKKQDLGFISDSQGKRYNIPLSEGVYRLKITNSTNTLTPFLLTVTVSNNKLTTENINFGIFP
jgi:hypothetical protein